MRTRLLPPLIGLVLPLVALDAFAQDRFASRPVRLVVPYPPGGGADFTGREIAQKLTEAWGQQVVVDNRPGAATAIGHAIVAKSPPDGYTLGLGSAGGMVVNPAMGTKLPYEAPKDFTTVGLIVCCAAPVNRLASAVGRLAVHASRPVTTTALPGAPVQKGG